MIARRRHLRNTAAGLLFVWLFALATSVAQACIAQSPHAAASHGDHCAEALLEGSSVVAGEPQPADDAAAWKAACSKFCSETTFPTAKVKAAPGDGDGDGAQPLYVPVAAADWRSTPLAPALRAEALGPPGDGRAGSSIPIVFLRLAL